jgi:hypothetical protein
VVRDEKEYSRPQISDRSEGEPVFGLGHAAAWDMIIIIPIAIACLLVMGVLVAGWIITLLKPCRRCDHAWMFHAGYSCSRCSKSMASHTYE